MPANPYRRTLRSILNKYSRLHAIARARRARKVRLLRPQIVPLEYTGKWVAWTPDGRTIVAVGESAKAAKAAAEERGVRGALCEWIPTRDEVSSVPRGEM